MKYDPEESSNLQCVMIVSLIVEQSIYFLFMDF